MSKQELIEYLEELMLMTQINIDFLKSQKVVLKDISEFKYLDNLREIQSVINSQILIPIKIEDD